MNTTTTKKNGKQIYLERLQSYHTYAESFNYQVPATKGINSGAMGTLYEMQVKAELKNFRSKGKAGVNTFDTRKKGFTFEIKTGAGEIATIDENGNITKSLLLKSDYVVYCPTYDTSYPAIEQGYLIPSAEFIPLLQSINLIRTKKSTHFSGDYPDKMTIQSFRFKNSDTAENRLYNALNNYPMLIDFLIDNDISYIEY